MDTLKTIPKCQVCGHQEVEQSTQKRDKDHELYLVRVAIDLLKSKVHFDF